jgi:serine/threonine protein kinase
MVVDDILILNLAVMLNFEELKVIGEGSFSTVYQALRKVDSRIYAIKKMKLSSLSPSEKLSCLN